MEKREKPIWTLTTQEFESLIKGVVSKLLFPSPPKTDPSQMEDDLVGLAEACRILKCKRSKIFLLKKSGILKSFSTVPRGKLLFKKSDLNQIIKPS
jgi:hypothetical protein